MHEKPPGFGQQNVVLRRIILPAPQGEPGGNLSPVTSPGL